MEIAVAFAPLACLGAGLAAQAAETAPSAVEQGVGNG
jgi:hypothetical protein